MSELNAVVVVYGTDIQTGEAVKKLQRAGIDVRTLSILGRDSHTNEHVVGYYNSGDRMRCWGTNGTFWESFWGVLFGSALFVIPGIGPVLVAGPVVAWIIGALECGAGFHGLSPIGAGLYEMGIPNESVVRYETALKSGRFLVIVHGTAPEAAQARDLLENTRPIELSLHSKAIVAAPVKWRALSMDL